MAHNNRKNIHGNPDIDKSKLDENVYFIQKDIRKVYEETFGEAVESYNAKQSRKDRRIEDYYDKIRHDSKTHEQRELIVAIGEGKDGEEYCKAKKDALIQYAEEFQERNLNLAVYNMVLHDDEANPHLHINYVPNFESKKGLTRRVGMDKALQQQGIDGKGMDLIKHWREKETAYIEELAKVHIPDFERANVGSHKYMKVPQFKKAKEAFKEIEADGLKKRQELVQVISDINGIRASKEALEAEYEAQEAIVREFKERGKNLTKITKRLGDEPQYKAPIIEFIYEPTEVNKDLLGRHVKIKKDEYEKMIDSQKETFEKYDLLAKNFDVLAERLKKANLHNYYLSTELEKAKEAIPVQTNDFVLKVEHEKVKKVLKMSEDRHKEKDRMIEQQQEQINDLRQRFKQFQSLCINFIKDNVPKAFDLMSSFAKKLNVVEEVNTLIKQDQEREKKEKKMQKYSRDEWER